MTLLLGALAALLLFGSYLVLRVVIEADIGDPAERARHTRAQVPRDQRRAA